MKYVIATAIVLVLAIGVMVIGPRWAQAQGSDRCGPTDKMTEVLKGAYGEMLMIIGPVNNNLGTMRYYANPKTLTWTIGVEKDGIFCMAITGTKMKPFIEGTDS